MYVCMHVNINIVYNIKCCYEDYRTSTCCVSFNRADVKAVMSLYPSGGV